MTTQDDFQLFWWGIPQAMRNGKPAALTAYKNRREKHSHDEIMERHRIWMGTGARLEDWYHLPWAQKWLNQYFDDVEGEILPPEKWSSEWWHNRCKEALNSRFMKQYFDQHHRQTCPAEIRAEYPQLYPKLRAIE